MNYSSLYHERFRKNYDELKRIYEGLYHDTDMLSELCDTMEEYFSLRSSTQRRIDRLREENNDWYKLQEVVAMQVDIRDYDGSLRTVQKNLKYMNGIGVDLVLLSPFNDSDSLEELAQTCHRKKMLFGTDFILNRVRSDHPWVRKALKNNEDYRKRFFIYDDPDIPNRFDDKAINIYPVTAPGNFSFLPKTSEFVMTTFKGDEWDLNYKCAAVFNDIAAEILAMANQGIDVIKLCGMAYLWKNEGTSCVNQPEVHSIIRMIRIITDVVCPGILLLGDAGLGKEEKLGFTDAVNMVTSYFGSEEHPECHLLYDSFTPPVLWNTFATQNCGLIKKQMDILNGVSRQFTFVNFLRNENPVDWKLDYDKLCEEAVNEDSHRRYLNDYYSGKTEGSYCSGTIINEAPHFLEDMIGGRTASLCGLERATMQDLDEMEEQAVRKIMLLHAVLLMETGIPMLYDGDEVGTINDQSFKKDISIEAEIYHMICRLIEIRSTERAFNCLADTWTLDTWDSGTFAMGRYYDGQKIIGVFNFSDQARTAWINEDDGDYIELITGQTMQATGVAVPAYSFKLLMKNFS